MEKKIFDSLAASDFKEHLSEHTLSSKQTYAHRSEKIVFSNAELASFIDSAYSCDYRLGGLWPNNYKLIIFYLIKDDV